MYVRPHEQVASIIYILGALGYGASRLSALRRRLPEILCGTRIDSVCLRLFPSLEVVLGFQV